MLNAPQVAYIKLCCRKTAILHDIIADSQNVTLVRLVGMSSIIDSPCVFRFFFDKRDDVMENIELTLRISLTKVEMMNCFFDEQHGNEHGGAAFKSNTIT